MPSSTVWSVRAVDVPKESIIGAIFPRVELADAYRIRLPESATTDPETLARFVFSLTSPWVTTLLRIRDTVVSIFGLKTAQSLLSETPGAAAQRVSFFRIYETREGEIILGEDDKHLDFRLSVLCQPRTEVGLGVPYLTLSTVVRCHNRLGRGYLFVITPFHKLIVRASLARAARHGWPRATA
jgi:hypothetical protein